METLVISLYVSIFLADDLQIEANECFNLQRYNVGVCLSVAEGWRSPETLLQAAGCGAAADGALALSQEISHFSRDLCEEYDLQTGN